MDRLVELVHIASNDLSIVNPVLFEFYDFNMDRYMLNQEHIVRDVLAHFQKVSEKLGTTVLPKEQLVNNMAYNILALGNVPVARELFELNITNYPESYNAYDSYGDFWMTQGEPEGYLQGGARAVSRKRGQN